MKHSTVEFGT